MIRNLFSGVALLLICALSEGQTANAPTPGSYLDVGGVKMWYEECGDLRTAVPGVVLLHDGLVHSITWDGVWAPLCAKYHVVRYDRRGYGRSEPSKAFFVPEDDLYRIMRQVHMDHAILIGNSSGGGLALDFALAHPEMVAALFLIGPVVHGMPSSDYFNERGSKNNEPRARGDRRAVAENWSKDQFLIAGDDQLARKKLYDALAQHPQNLTVAGGLEIPPSPSTVQRLSQIRAPTLVLVGDGDIADVFACSGAIEAAVPLSVFEVWKDTGHLIQIQRPAELVARFDRFFCLATREAPASFGQSPFDGTWVTIAPLPQKPALYVLAKGVFRCSGCIANLEVKADGSDHKVAETAYWDTFNVQIVDARTVEIIAKKAGRTMLTEVDAISPDGSTLTQLVKDTTEAETVTIETRNRRIDKGPDGSHAISGSWRAYKTNRSRNGSIVKYKCTAEGFSAETPLGERFNAKFDGNDYPVEDDPGRTMVSAKLLSPDTVELTSKRNGEVVAIKRMSVAPGGKSIHVVFQTKEGNTIMAFDMQKEP